MNKTYIYTILLVCLLLISTVYCQPNNDNGENKEDGVTNNHNKETTDNTETITNNNKHVDDGQETKGKLLYRDGTTASPPLSSKFKDPMNDQLKYNVISTKKILQNKDRKHRLQIQQLNQRENPKLQQPPIDLNDDFDVDMTQLVDSDDSTTTQYQSVNMVLKDGQKYTCKIPVHVEQPKVEWKAIPSVEEIGASIKLPNKCITKLIGWWTYEFCQHSYIKQMRIEKQQNLNEYYLGYYFKDETQPTIKGIDEKQMKLYSEKGEFDLSTSPYYSETFIGGTPCDIIDANRQTEIRYYCSEDRVKGAYIGELLEPTSCSYLLKIYTPDMCSHPIFRPKQDKVLDIKCTPLTKPQPTPTTTTTTPVSNPSTTTAPAPTTSN
ncbi:hypothetical protein CYY_007014 [Polysphondylium violaceum]|uniref:MRH domain-containing protein n=1 Tax=Polysphondylium violaceum TaxID=133409 RepID=A0A8J4PRJ3_9MYCE|nr:hypothetical protein CYY_007014 [Polysphondylium violaceum]